ncbi:MAG: HD domain-containing protein [Thermofilum sp.]
MQVPECEALKEFGLACPLLGSCGGRQPPLPSFFHEKRPAGCWAAHTALTLLEAVSLLRSAGGVLPRKGLQPESLAVAALLHDAGKLSSAYLEGRDPFHNVTSALIALRVLDPAKPESRAIAQAILLHHEHRMWEYLSRGGVEGALLAENYHDLLRRYSVRCAVLESASQKLVRAVEAAVQLAEQLFSASGDRAVQRAALSPLESLPNLSRVCLRVSDEKVLLDEALAPRSLPLYYLLQLADNRAAWLREGVSWRREMGKLVDVRCDPLELAQQLLVRYGGKSRLLLTLHR